MFVFYRKMQGVPRPSICLCLVAGLLLGLSGATSVSAAPDFYVVIVRSVDPVDYLLVERVQINGRGELTRIVRDGPLTEQQYRNLSSLPLAEVRSFRIEGGRLRVRRRNGDELLAVPRDFRDWSRAWLDPGDITRGSLLTGVLYGRQQAVRSPLADGWVVYVFAAYPGQDGIAFALADTRNTEEGWVRFLKNYPDSANAVEARQFLAGLYLTRTREALERYQEALSKKTPGYAALGDARTWFDRLRATNVQTAGVVEVEGTLTRLETDVAERLRQAPLLAARGDFAGAEKILEPLAPFGNELPELAAALESLKQSRARHHLEQARRLFSAARFDEALYELNAAASYQALPEIPGLRREIESRRLGHTQQAEINGALATAREAMERKDYARAFESLGPVVSRYPDDPNLQTQFSSLRRRYTETLLAEAAHVEELHTPVRGPADEDALLHLHKQLTRVSQFESAPPVAVWRDRLGMILADYYRERSEEVARRYGTTPSPLAFAYLHQARHYLFDKSELPQFAAWRDRVEEELQVGVALTVRDLTPEGNGQYLAAELSTTVGAAIQEAGFPHVRIFDTSGHATAKPTLELVIELLHSGVGESAQTEQVASEYSAGVRQVPSPKWREAKAEYDRAVENYEKVRARVDRNRQRAGYTERERQSDNLALARAEGALDRARKNLDSVPAYVEQEDTRAYEFNRRTITRTGEIRLAYRWVNALTGVREVQQLLAEKEPAEGVEISGVHPADKNGRRNQSADLSDAATLRGRALRKIQKPLTERAVDYVRTFIDRDFERAQEEAGRGNHETAAEYYLRFLFNSPPEDGRRQSAFDYLERQFRLVALGDWLAVKNNSY